MRTTFGAITIALALTDCTGGSKSKDTPGTADLPTLGLKIDLLSTKATVDESAIDGASGVEINSKAYPDRIMIAVEKAIPSPEEETQDTAFNARDHKIEKLSDGFVVTWKLTSGGSDRLATRAYRTIRGKTVSCFSMTSTPEQQQAVVAACKSITAK